MFHSSRLCRLICYTVVYNIAALQIAIGLYSSSVLQFCPIEELLITLDFPRIILTNSATVFLDQPQPRRLLKYVDKILSFISNANMPWKLITFTFITYHSRH